MNLKKLKNLTPAKTSSNTAYLATLAQYIYIMSDSHWEQFKKKETYLSVSTDEILLIILGVTTFLLPALGAYKVYFIGFVIIWYWLKLRMIERKIHKKKQEIYNVEYDKAQPITQDRLDAEIRIARKPMYYDLEQLEFQRKALVDKFVVVNLILVILIQLFIDSK